LSGLSFKIFQTPFDIVRYIGNQDGFYVFGDEIILLTKLTLIRAAI
jgi:hypothetical protein